MPPNSSDNNTVRTITVSSLFTCTYTSILISALFYFRNLYNIGRRTCLPVIGIIIIAECFKLSLSSLYPDTGSAREKSNKIKKYHFKNKFKSVLVILTMIVAYYVIAVLFGAPFASEQEETLMFSLLLTTLTVLPACLNLGADVAISVLTGLTTFQGDLIVEVIKRGIILTLFGAWLGAIVIPLDWDRPWQVWPVPCSLGAIVGYFCSHVLVILGLVPKFNKLFAKRTGKYGL